MWVINFKIQLKTLCYFYSIQLIFLNSLLNNDQNISDGELLKKTSIPNCKENNGNETQTSAIPKNTSYFAPAFRKPLTQSNIFSKWWNLITYIQKLNYDKLTFRYTIFKRSN